MVTMQDACIDLGSGEEARLNSVFVVNSLQIKVYRLSWNFLIKHSFIYLNCLIVIHRMILYLIHLLQTTPNSFLRFRKLSAMLLATPTIGSLFTGLLLEFKFLSY